MTAQDVLKVVASMEREDWMKIQVGIAEMMAADLSPEELSEIREAVEESHAHIARGDVLASEGTPKAARSVVRMIYTQRVRHDIEKIRDYIAQNPAVAMSRTTTANG